MAAADDDWRLQGQESYLRGASLHWATYRPASATNDHDHCEFCWAKFMEQPLPDTLQQGYATEDCERWICCQCFDDFRDRFAFVTAEPT